MTELTVRESINQALAEEIERDERVFLYGEDVGDYGGLYQVTEGLQEQLGDDRVFDTPLSETTLGGTVVGAALTGSRPIVEIMFGDFLSVIADHLINYAAKMHFNYGDGTSVPLVVRTTYGGGDQFGLHHSQDPMPWFQNVPGLKMVAPATPYDYKGLLKAAVRDDDPVVFFENKQRYEVSGDVPDEDYTVPIGEADIKRRGEDMTIVAIGGMVDVAMEAADELDAQGYDCEVIDPRTVMPLDKETILESVKKTHGLTIVHESAQFGGMGGEIAAEAADEALYYLDAPVKRVAAPFTPVPFAENLEQSYLPNADDVEAAVIDALEG
ncbi:Pyruvate/2-oxoglutarate/acetoin dehydrogenase complex, dehydrogenase (E1) component, beta subunit [Halanaeroarchaeum sp. HSR-CO]|uniref:alpha-ketoacid dehydrogenase subunit beta n=1 Tax=Halanaeroarchaeum sp. HSR-CO TaxID=2866382 RepID=UPI00217D8AEB|nr:alpha-ketoacid dehydrogenase subunit beta [Halanaeroarchaeum sp. HSR-CO]UWG47096.1 Pyruvate/2-oxoglutarate/acetoin dehydrogenase complex, dehydrogenase (E1) component, beta subunit [Halanaeroarchaeum sp. HSR-CO]